MISARSARDLADGFLFRNSGFASLLNSAIHGAALRGNSRTDVLVPRNVARESARFLTRHGFRVVCSPTMTGVLLRICW